MAATNRENDYSLMMRHAISDNSHVGFLRNIDLNPPICECAGVRELYNPSHETSMGE